MTWSVGRITLLLYPLGVGAIAVNVFFASLLGSWVGLPVLTAAMSICFGCIMALPLTWLFARHIRSLMDATEEDQVG